MTGIQGTFDASQFKPMYGFDKVLPGKHPFRIANTEITPTKDGQGGMFVVTFQTPQGSIQDRYNLWNNSPKAVEIAYGQLSALCHAVGIFKLDWQNEGAVLRNAEGQIEVGWQKGSEPTTENPNGGYTEVKRIYDRNGNEPGKQSAAPPAPQPTTQATPMQQQPNGGWTPPNQQTAPSNQQPPNTGWGGQGTTAGQQQPAQPTQAAPWSQGQAAQNPNPPWGQK